jgi:hypothetical protein
MESEALGSAGSARRPVSRRRVRQRFIAQAIVANTQRLVDQSLRGEWSQVPATLAARRSLLADLERDPGTDQRASDCLDALRASVAESERVLALLLPDDAAIA